MQFEMASQNSIEALQPYVDRILVALEELFDVESGMYVDALVSDESFISDFTPWICVGRESSDRREALRIFFDTTYKRLSEKLGIELNSTNDDDCYIVRVAHKLKMREHAASA